MEETKKKQRGQPKKAQAQKHENLVTLRFSDAQIAYIEAQSESRSVYMRRLLDADMKGRK